MTFANEVDKLRVEDDKPWLFDSNLFILKDLDGSRQLAQTQFNRELFWIRLYKLPFRCMNRFYKELIGNTLGEVLEVEVDFDDIAWGPFLRVHVRLNILKPLARG